MIEHLVQFFAGDAGILHGISGFFMSELTLKGGHMHDGDYLDDLYAGVKPKALTADKIYALNISMTVE